MMPSIARLTAFLLVAAALAAHAQSAPSKSNARGISPTPFEGWKDSLLMESRDTPIRAIVTPQIGGRVVFYGPRDRNLLWIDPAAAGKTASTASGPFDPGGFIVDRGPESARLDPASDLLVGPWDASPRKGYVISLRSPEDKTGRVEVERLVMFDPSSGELGFEHRAKNTSERDTTVTLLHRIACQPGGYALLPLSKKSRFSAGWSIRRGEGARKTYDGNKPESEAVQVLDGVLVARTGGPATKIGADSDAQWVAYALGRSLFVVHFPVYPSATYSEGGNSVTLDWDERRTELQPLSAEQRVRSRKTLEFPMKWSIIDLPAEVTSHAEARRLAELVPSSPFL